MRTTYRSKAKVKISYGNTGAAAGMATIGATPGAFVHLSPKWDAVRSHRSLAPDRGDGDLHPRAGARPRLRAHHDDVLADEGGAGHQRLPPARVPARPATTSAAPSTRRSCAASSSGTAAAPTFPAATWCLIDPLPSALTGVSFSGGVDSPVTVRWATRPTTVPTGSKVEIRTWPGAAVHGHAGVGRLGPGRADSPAVAGRPSPDERDVLLPGQAGQPLRRRPGRGSRA